MRNFHKKFLPLSLAVTAEEWVLSHWVWRLLDGALVGVASSM